jgi:type II secretory pathway pseudopilin PulG
MNTQPQERRTAAFTLVELLAITVVIALLFAALLPGLAKAKRESQRVRCTSQLKEIGVGFRLFATDHGDKYPTPAITNQVVWPVVNGKTNYAAGYFRALFPELSKSHILVCPADQREPASSSQSLADTNISYFVNLDADETRPQMLLTGDRNLSVNGQPAQSGLLVLMTKDRLGWTRELHRGVGNVALGDASVQNVTSERLSSSVADTNRLAVP